MKYIYYPGCTLDGSSQEYDRSTRALMAALGAELVEIEDWTCCGAGAAEANSRLMSLVLPARNLALAERLRFDADILVPCSACYLNMKRVGIDLKAEPGLADKVNQALAVENLSYQGGLKVRHLLDVLVTDFAADDITAQVTRPLSGLRVAPYYGCQSLRPYLGFDDPQRPISMERLINALGAEVHPWEMGAKCCGAALMTTKKEIGQTLSGAILKAAQGADCITTVCPMCQTNLDGFQKGISRREQANLTNTIIYLPQLIGLALGLNQDTLKLGLNLSVTKKFLNKLAA
ncbi:MAG: CoB--CoM heterodisulfide reductase iron-sulfur subunit B family protein [Deltaproteobacteria bacterium]|nr:CoB--CoM heterodisulfide reductase iron-sulfur subunit B family protein [Deltaproteobacteria bacterium]MBF0525621.1 CoB--CoM heterodisulfide reductase iron-sulfur subunit B family protein [Deltaproteobacteria bacterium]